MSLSTVEKNKILDYLVNQSNMTAPTTPYLSLHTADPGTTGASEVTDGTYARQNVTAAFPAASSGSVSNDVAITYPAATTGFTATHYGIWTAVTAGTFIHGGDISPDKAVGAGEQAQFAIGTLTITAG